MSRLPAKVCSSISLRKRLHRWQLTSLINRTFRAWIIDLASPGQLKLMQRTTGRELSEAGAAFKFGSGGRRGLFQALWMGVEGCSGIAENSGAVQTLTGRTCIVAARAKAYLGELSMDGCMSHGEALDVSSLDSMTCCSFEVWS